MDMVAIDVQTDSISDLDRSIRAEARYEGLGGDLAERVHLDAERLDHLDLQSQRTRGRLRDMFGANAEHERLPRARDRFESLRQRERHTFAGQFAVTGELDVEEIHRRAADESGDK